MKKYNCEKCGKELVNLSANDMVATYWCDDCNKEYEFNKYDALITEAKVRCMSEYVFNICAYDNLNGCTIEDIEDNIRITLKETEVSGFTIDSDGMWYLYGDRC